jgi:hypothetical protein
MFLARLMLDISKVLIHLGVDMVDPYAQDDIVVKELYIPKGQKNSFQDDCKMFLHSAYMPYFRAQMNCVNLVWLLNLL